MRFRTILFDLVFLLSLTAILILFNETGKMNSLMKYPLIVIYGAYILGRLAGVLSGRGK